MTNITEQRDNTTNATTNDIEEKVIRIVENTLKAQKGTVTRDTNFVDDLKADSLDQVELMMELEAQFNCDISDEKASNIKTVNEAIQHIESQQKRS